MTPLLYTAGGLIAGACVGYALRGRLERCDHDATFRAGVAYERFMQSTFRYGQRTAAYDAPGWCEKCGCVITTNAPDMPHYCEPVEMDGRETWGRA